MAGLITPRQHPVVQTKIAEIARLCRRLGVTCLDLFGSATGDAFDATTSDVDVVVEFPDLPDFDHFESYFDLKEGLERILDRPVGTMTECSIANPYLRAQAEASGEIMYAA